jgi:argininosuccinate lyase
MEIMGKDAYSMKQLWTGRIEGAMDEGAAALNASLAFDMRLALQDLRGSIVWAHALAKIGILTTDEANQIGRGLDKIGKEIAGGIFALAATDEDIHTTVERRLGELIGEAAGKLHTGRSRNDQVTTDFRLWLMEADDRLHHAIRRLQESLVNRSEQDFGIAMPGYTHTQRAQPVLLSHWWLSHFWALDRDAGRLSQLRARTAVCPLGSGALAGTAFPVDREAIARELGFARPSDNSIDAVSDRDFAAEFLFFTALLGVHLSRLADALILFSTSEFGFVEMDDAFSTGSSLMPQKKNPDVLELVRGKSGKLIGLLTGLLSTLKGLPSAYDKDLQEDKQPVFEAADTLESILPVLARLIGSLSIHKEKITAAIDDGMLATDLADYLVRKGIPFRAAHTAAGRAVRRSIELGIPLTRMKPEEYRKIDPGFGADLAEVFNVETSIARRGATGGTAPESVKKQIQKARAILAEN